MEKNMHPYNSKVNATMQATTLAITTPQYLIILRKNNLNSGSGKEV